MVAKKAPTAVADTTEDQNVAVVENQNGPVADDNVTVISAGKKPAKGKAKPRKPRDPARHNIDELSMRKAVGQRIKRLREDSGLTQLKFSEAVMAKAGACSRQAVAQWERGAASPSNGMLVILAKLLKTTPSYLAFGDKGADNSTARAVSQVPSALVLVPEVSFGESPTVRNTIRQWGLPREVVSEITHNKPEDIYITTVVGDTISDQHPAHSRVYVDSKDLRPDGSPMGFWDGYGIAFAYISPVLGKAKTLRIHGNGVDETMDAEEVVLMGKVKRSA